MLAERFDRVAAVGTGVARRQIVSLLTVLGVSEMNSRYSSYAQLAEEIRTGPWTDIPATLRELFTRLVFNVCIGNTDDHLRNHAAFWDGKTLTLTPAYDLTPQPRSTSTASQAIGITTTGERASQLRLCRAVARAFTLSTKDADLIIDHVRGTIVDSWSDTCDTVGLTAGEAKSLLGREVLNPYIDYDEA